MSSNAVFFTVLILVLVMIFFHGLIGRGLRWCGRTLLRLLRALYHRVRGQPPPSEKADSSPGDEPTTRRRKRHPSSPDHQPGGGQEWW